MIDAITLEVIHCGLESIAEEMELVLFKSSFSSIVKEAKDATTALFDNQANTIAQAVGHPIHLGTMMQSVPQIVKAFPRSEIKEGDAYIANDPYTGGTHLPDITMVVPVIYHGEVLAFACNVVHHQDIGAMTPGVPTSATSIYQEGLNLPPVKFYDAGRPVQVVHDIIKNNVRCPDMVIGDLRAQLAASNTGKVRLLELFDQYGKDVLLSALQELQNHAEVLTRKALNNIPNGSYFFVDYLDNDGIDLDKRINIQATITIRGSEFIADFSGTSSQVKGPFNVTPSGVLAAACYVLKIITSECIFTNAGCFRPISLNLPEGSLVNPRPPAAVGSRASTINTIANVLMGALVQAVPERLPACPGPQCVAIYFGGTDPLNGQEYITLEFGIGGQGARPTKDGIDLINADVGNGLGVPHESIEKDFPIRVLKAGLKEDSAGAGKYRGGLGWDWACEILRGSVHVTYRGERHYVAPWGLFGGLPGSKSRAFIVRTTGEIEEIPSKRDMILNEGDQLHVSLSGGGGYGDPLDREPALVLNDVLNRRVSVKAATNDYGVVINKNSMTIDFEKMNELRKERKKLRGAISWTYDRGPDGGKE